jgi:hypothetical protein
MIDRDTSGVEAIQINQIVGEACREAFKWLCRREYGIDYVPPLFRSGCELPVVPRIAPSRIEGDRRSARR